MVYGEAGEQAPQSPGKANLKASLEDLRELCQPKSRSSCFMQLIASPGAGARQLAFQVLKAKQVAWLSPDWNLYAPLLWQRAEQAGWRLLGVECKDRKRLRSLWKELACSQVFDGWVLDGFQLKASESAYLQKLLRHLSLKVLVIDAKANSFCTERAQVFLSHHQFRLNWIKGRNPKAVYYPAPYLSHFVSPKESIVCLS